MKNRTKTVLLSVSLAVNALFLALLIPALFLKTASVVFQAPDEGSITAAAIASVPADGGSVTFNPAEITLRQGSSAYFQFSLLSAGKQANWPAETLYDRNVISVKPDGYGLRVAALAPGETALQTLTPEGIRDYVLVKVAE